MSQSLFFTSADRIQFVIVGKETTVYSLSLTDDRQYVMRLPADIKINVPGGYGAYRVGSLTKLVALEKKPEILKKGFSLATSSFVTYYFYTSDEPIYYGGLRDDEFVKHNPRLFLTLSSNANIFDRLFLFLKLTQIKDGSLTSLNYKQEIDSVHDDVTFDSDSFRKRALGLMYQERFRKENKTVQIQYSQSYITARGVGTILEGNGIRINDIAQTEKADQDSKQPCVVVENTQEHSITTKAIASFFGCSTKEGSTDVYDIIVVLNNTEKDWQLLKQQ